MASLFNKRVVITRPRHQATTLVEMIRERSGQPICIPVIEIEPLEDFTQLDQALRQVQTYDWLVLTSANGVDAMMERIRALGLGDQPFAGVKVAAIGSAISKTISACAPRFAKPMTSFICSSRQARRQRVH